MVNCGSRQMKYPDQTPLGTDVGGQLPDAYNFTNPQGAQLNGRAFVRGNMMDNPECCARFNLMPSVN